MTYELLKRIDHSPYTYMHYAPYPDTSLFNYLVDNKSINPLEILTDWTESINRYATQMNLSEIPDSILF